MIRVCLAVFLLLTCKQYEHAATTESTAERGATFLTIENSRIAVKDAQNKVLPTAVHEIVPYKRNSVKIRQLGEGGDHSLPFYLYDMPSFKRIIYSYREDNDTVATCVLANQQLMQKIDNRYYCSYTNNDALVDFIKICKQREGRLVSGYDAFRSDEVIWVQALRFSHFACVFTREDVGEIAIPSYCFDGANIDSTVPDMQQPVGAFIDKLFQEIVPKAVAKSNDGKYTKCDPYKGKGEPYENKTVYYFSRKAAEDSGSVVTKKTLLKNMEVSFKYKQSPTEIAYLDEVNGTVGPFEVNIWCADNKKPHSITFDINKIYKKPLSEVFSACIGEKVKEGATLSDLGKIDIYIHDEGSLGQLPARFSLNPSYMIAAPRQQVVSWCMQHGASWSAYRPCLVLNPSEYSMHYISIGLQQQSE